MFLAVYDYVVNCWQAKRYQREQWLIILMVCLSREHSSGPDFGKKTQSLQPTTSYPSILVSYDMIGYQLSSSHHVPAADSAPK